MKILAVGGGSGGHVTPVVAVLREIKSQQPAVSIRFWCDRKFLAQAKGIINNYDRGIRVDSIVSGKFRRYSHVPMWRQMLWPSVVLPNLRDMFFVAAGTMQSIFKMIVWRPNVVFTKGGFVCLPVGMAARLLRIPLVIHDSDAHPGLTNRILARWATRIATGAPLEYYDYPKERSSYVGIPVRSEFQRPSEIDRRNAKERWKVDPDKPLLVVTGGGLGAQRLNNSVVKALEELLAITSVVIISGSSQYQELRETLPKDSGNFRLIDFVADDMAGLLGAADVVVARAGATTILELAALARPTILVPNPHLTGSHQVKNAAVYSDKNVVIVLNESDIDQDGKALVEAVKGLISNPRKANDMAEAFHAFAKPNAAKDMADIVLSSARRLG